MVRYAVELRPSLMHEQKNVAPDPNMNPFPKRVQEMGSLER